MTNIIEVCDLTYTYPDGTQALRGMNVTFQKGEKIAVLGSNGAGKSTFFLCLNGILKPQGGTVLYDGQPVRYDSKGLIALRKQVGIVFQDPDAQLFSASVYQEVSFGAMNLKLSEAVVRERVDSALNEMNITDLKEKPTHFLSYGQKKRVSIADILVMEPQVIIFDEPASCLDPKHAHQIDCLFDNLSRNGVTVVVSTHHVEMAWSWADKVIVLDQGVVAAVGTPLEIFGDADLLERTSLEKPPVLDVFECLQENGSIPLDVPAPRTTEQLKRLIAQYRKG
ncbi:MAG: ATP-binding cassette domain-containing protein [Hyphomonadaceae bacterium]|nr:ATP-binding cassette domain-containing protein [Clostridia bacterium]